ncbi:hypothetical protein BPO_p0069 (plasmid) [Bergeyella porcorum]|uniref:Uncharacterized protein n=1 Tax=Bergeyella porcorum TaxID=1735111 RepID=A0AAU0F424_9FLAO
MSTKSDIEKIIKDSSGDINKIASELGYPLSQIENDVLIRIDLGYPANTNSKFLLEMSLELMTYGYQEKTS